MGLAVEIAVKIVYIMLCYLLGSVLTGVWVARLADGRDLRSLGSGNAGARNAGRHYGKTAFALTFLGDVAKGAAAVLGACLIDGAPEYALAALLAVLLGHIHPVFHGWRGGKGMSVFCGASLALDWAIWLEMILIAAVLLLLFRRFTPAGLIGVIVFPALLAWKDAEVSWSVLIAAAAAVWIVIAHRSNIHDMLKKRS